MREPAPEPKPEPLLPPTPWDRQKELEEAGFSGRRRPEQLPLEEYRTRAIIEYGKAEPGDLLSGIFIATHGMTPENFVKGLITGDSAEAELLLLELYGAYKKVQDRL